MTSSSSTATRLVGCAISAIVVLVILAVAGTNLLSPGLFAEEYDAIGMAYDLSTRIGVLLLVCAVLYAVPLTSFLGAVFITGVAGGVIFAHFRLGEIGTPPQILAVAVAACAWLGLHLRWTESPPV